MKCRICGTETREFLDLGDQPIANNFLKKEQLNRDELFYQLILTFCPTCYVVQLENTIPPSSMFNDKYPFVSSSSDFMVCHFNGLADMIKKNYLDEEGFIVELGSNDGTFLRNFKSYQHLGIEPSKNVAEYTKDLFIISKFFDDKLSKDICKAKGYADVIVSANVFPHIEDRDTVLKGIKRLLKPGGVWINEEVYLGAILLNMSYDQFYNEHIYTSSIASFRVMAQMYGLEVVNCEFQNVHGGSMRYYITHWDEAMKKGNHLKRLVCIVNKEELVNYNTLKNFGISVEQSREAFLYRLSQIDDPIVGYGATAKSSTILNYCGIGPETIGKIYDTTPEKQGKYSPGKHIPIVSYDEFHKDNPKNVVLFAWNHAKEIFEKEKGKDINWILPI